MLFSINLESILFYLKAIRFQNLYNIPKLSSQHSHSFAVMDQEQTPQCVQIDDQWISFSAKNQPMIDFNLLTCMICYGIPLGQYAECLQCGRIFCYEDFNKTVNKINACPNCKKSPFVKKAQPHILYRSMFERLKFQCQLCNDPKHQNYSNSGVGLDEKSSQKKRNLGNQFMVQTFEEFKIRKLEWQGNPKNSLRQQQKAVKEEKIYSKQQLFKHINDCHNKKIINFNILYDFQIYFDKESPTIILDMYQNLELNQKLLDCNDAKEFHYQLQDNSILIFNLKTQTVKNLKSNKVGKIIKHPSKTLNKDTEYIVWQVHLENEFKNYSSKCQQQIKNSYQEFLMNKKKNQMMIDIKDQRYRISFNKMQQINTYSEYSRPIKKNIVKFL